MIAATVALFTVLTLISVPVAFAVGIAVAIGLALFSSFPMAILIQKMVTGVDNFVLVAIPLFILTGNLMNAGGITDRIFTFVRACVGHMPAGLAHANVGASVVFAGVSGSAVADAAGMGAIEIKAMTDAGYERPFSAAVTAASSVIGPIIPPSIPMILYGVIAEVSVGQLFAAGIVPGLILAVTLSAQIAWMSRGGRFPRDRKARAADIWRAFRSGFFALATPVVMLGGLLGGVFTPTEAGAVAAGYALLVSLLVYRSMSIAELPRVLVDTMLTTAIVLFIIAAVSPFSWMLVITRSAAGFVGFVKELTSDPVAVLLLVNLALLVLGAVMESGAVLVLMAPLLVPLAASVGVDPVHFGIIMVLNLMIGVATPPVGMALFVTAHIASIPVERMMRAILPFIPPMLVTLALVTYWPALSLTLPRLFFGAAQP